MTDSLPLWPILLVTICSLLVAVECREVVCYYGTWAAVRTGDGKFTGDNINPSQCTQLVYAFLNVDRSGAIIDTSPRISTGEYQMFAKFRGLKQRNPALKIMFAIGGYNAEQTANFAIVAANAKLRTTFAKNAVAVLQKNGFDGIDIDWLFPESKDKANFVWLLGELLKAFEPYKYLLTVAVGAPEFRANEAYDIPMISGVVNFINLMTYDMQGDYGVARHHAAFSQGPANLDDTSFKRKLNVEASINYWLSKGASPSKLNLGIPFYGRSYRLTNPREDGVGAPISGIGKASDYTGEPGARTYYEICPASPFSRKEFDWVQVGAYASGNGEWVSYDSVESISQKCHVIAKYGLGGAMIWSIEQDDFFGKCGSKFPLLTALNKCVNRRAAVTTTPAYISPTPGCSSARSAPVVCA